MWILFFSIVSFLVSSSHETFVKENRFLWGGVIVESVASATNPMNKQKILVLQSKNGIPTRFVARTRESTVLYQKWFS